VNEGAYSLALRAKDAGDWPTAYRLAQDAWHQSTDEQVAAEAALVAGIAAHEMGQADEAVRCYRAAGRAFEAAGDQERLAAARFNEGLALFRASRLVEAISVYENAVTLFEAQGNDRNRATCLMNLGNACRHAGKLAEALALYQQSRSAFQELGDEDRLGRCYLNAGNVLADLGRHRESSAMFERAREKFRSTGALQHEAGAIVNLGDLALREGRSQEAIELARSARELFEQAKLNRFLAECDLLEGKASRSLDLVRQAIDRFESFGDRRQAAGSRVVASDLIDDQVARVEELVRAADQLIALREEFQDPSSAAQASKPLTEVSGRLVEALCAGGNIEGAWEWLQRLREHRPRVEIGRNDHPKSRELRAEIEEIDQNLAAGGDGQDVQRRRREAVLAELSAQEFRSTQAISAQSATEAPSLELVRAELTASVVIIEAVVSPSAIHFLALSQKELLHRQVPIDRQELEDAIRLGREQMTRPSGGSCSHPLLEGLAVTLRELALGFSLVVWCPDDVLEPIPIGSWLIDSGIGWMQSACSSYWLATPSHASAGPPLVAGISQHRPGMGDLPEARKEAELVAGILGNCQLLLDDEASIANVHGAIKEAAIVHLATHAVPNEAVPMYSQLELASGPLYGRDLMDWGIRSELVMLSACSTAEGQRSAAGSSIGLAWALLASGARAVVASSWPVHDHAARLWVGEFYRSYVETRDPAVAHSRACEVLVADQTYSSPHYWATWKVLGSRHLPASNAV